MNDDRRDEDKIVDAVLRPDDSLGEKRGEHARRRPPSTRRSGSSGRKSKGKSGWGGRRVFLWILILALLGAGGWFGWQRFQPEMDSVEFTITEEDLPEM